MEEPEAAMSTGWILQEMDIFCKRAVSHFMVEHFSADWMAVHKISLVKQLCNVGFIMLETHVLGSRLGEGRLESRPKPLSLIL